MVMQKHSKKTYPPLHPGFAEALWRVVEIDPEPWKSSGRPLKLSTIAYAMGAPITDGRFATWVAEVTGLRVRKAGGQAVVDGLKIRAL
jgi:hypothetical protein